MGSAPRSRRTAPEPHALTVAPFDAAGRGVGDVPPTVAVETPDDETALLIYTEAEGKDAANFDRCMTALDAFRAGYDAAGGRSLTAALVAGMEAANDALIAPRSARERGWGIGLTALAVRGPDAYVIQAGPGQALIAGADTLVALPPLTPQGKGSSGRVAARVAAAADHAPALGTTPDLEPDLFHVDASGGLCAALCHSSFAGWLARDDSGPLRSFDAQIAADHLVQLAHRHRLADGCGVVISAGEVVELPASAPRPPPRLAPARSPRAARSPAPSAPRPRAPYANPYADGYDAYDDEDAPAQWGGESDEDDLPPSPRSHRPVAPPLSPPRRAPARSSRPLWADGVPDPYADADSDDSDTDVWEDDARYATRPPLRRNARGGRVAGIPTRLLMLIVAALCTLLVFLGTFTVRAWNDHQADATASRELDAIDADRARAQALAQRDPQAAYGDLEPLLPRLDAVAKTGRQPQRVQAEQAALAKLLDSVGNVTRVAPRMVGPLDHLDGKPGEHRLLLMGEDGQLYLLDRNDKGEWAVFSYDVVAGKRGSSLFATGQIALRGAAGDLRGLFWSGSPATSDKSRLFVRNANGAWVELPLAGLSERRPAAVTLANDVLYALDTTSGQIVRTSLRDGTAAKVWTGESAVPDLKTAVDIVADGQTVWVLLADGRVRGFAGGTTAAAAQLVTPAVLPPLRGVSAITTTASSPFLYIAEAQGGRILRIRKADGRLVQAFRAAGENTPGLDNIQSMAVDESRGVFYCVTADGVLSFPLPAGIT